MYKIFVQFFRLLLPVIVPLLSHAQTTSSVYNISMKAIMGNDTIQLSEYEGKKMLVVNTASLSDSVSQLDKLLTLLNIVGDDKLLIIVCPSNSFGKEPGNLDEIRTRYNSYERPGILISELVLVTGEQREALYEWLGKKTMNGVMNGKVLSDFNKFLINETGDLIGFFGKEVTPVSPLILRVMGVQNQ